MRSGDINEKIEKLPRAIRNYIVDIETDLRACKESLAERTKTSTVWGWGEDSTEHGMASGYIPDDQDVRFFKDAKHHEWVEIRRGMNGQLRISASHGIIIRLLSSNRAVITVDREGEFL